MGFGRACTPVRCAHPSFWAHCHAQRGAARPPPPIAASLILPAIFWGQNYVPVQPYGLIFSVFPFLVRFGSFLLLFCSFSSFLFNFFLFISSYILNCLLHLIFFSSYILNCLLYCRHEISIILRGFSRGPSLF